MFLVSEISLFGRGKGFCSLSLWQNITYLEIERGKERRGSEINTFI